jgi:hypothetical protein
MMSMGFELRKRHTKEQREMRRFPPGDLAGGVAQKRKVSGMPASPGPNTPAGKARVAGNAQRHGLSVPALWDATQAAELEALARRICPPGAGDAITEAQLLDLARHIAEAQIDLMRVRRARHDLIATDCADPAYRTSKGLMGRIAMLLDAGLMLQRGEPVPPAMATVVRERPEGADKFAVIVAELSPQLNAMDRYERRALARRRSAVRAYDAAVIGRSGPLRPGARKNTVFTKQIDKA